MVEQVTHLLGDDLIVDLGASLYNDAQNLILCTPIKSHMEPGHLYVGTALSCKQSQNIKWARILALKQNSTSESPQLIGVSEVYKYDTETES